MRQTASKRGGNHKPSSRHEKKIRTISLLLLVLAAFLAAGFFLEDKVGLTGGGEEEDNFLLLVNRWNKVPDHYTVDLTLLSNGESVATSIYPSLQAMFDDARAAGVYPVVASGYRTEEEQQALFDEKIETYMDQGYDRAEAESLAENYVSLPGTSEHQLGLAVDINADPMKSTAEDVYTWLAENAYQYGFVLRYPEDKVDITGTSYEAWHYRYVGADAATTIYNENLCLEEYIEKYVTPTEETDE